MNIPNNTDWLLCSNSHISTLPDDIPFMKNITNLNMSNNDVDSYKCLWAFIGCYTRFSGLQSSLGNTNVNRSHNKPLELIETI